MLFLAAGLTLAVSAQNDKPKQDRPPKKPPPKVEPGKPQPKPDKPKRPEAYSIVVGRIESVSAE